MTRTPRLLAALATTTLTLVGLAGQAHGQAFYLQEQSAKGAGRAFSGEVADTGADSLWWNPAAIAGSTEREGALNVAAILPHGQVVDRGTLIRRPGQAFAGVGGDTVSSNPIRNGVLPSGAIALPLTDRVAFGIAFTSPYSFTTQYGANSWARYSADRTKLLTVDIQPSLAVAVTDWLRVGAGPNVEYSSATLSNKLPNILSTLPDGTQALVGDGWDVGYTAGFQMHNDVLTVGFTYKSSIAHHLKGTLSVTGLVGPLATSNTSLSGIEARFRTPAQIILGTRIRATPRLTLNGQIVRYTWGDFDAIRLGAPINSAIPENYGNSWSQAAGIDYELTPALTVRMGAQHANTPTQNGNRDARVPDADRWNGGLGLTARVSRHLSVDAATNYVSFKDASIDRLTAAYAGTAAQTPIVTNGVLTDAHAVVLSLGARLGF